MNRICVVGASLAGLSTARALRAQGYDGELVVVGEETHRPYDRPPLSKEFLTGASVEDIALESDTEDLAVTWRLGVRAVGLTEGPVVHLDDGEELACDGVVLATGAFARRQVIGSHLPGVHVLRTIDDALGLRDALERRGPVVVVGGGFVGSEVASTARWLGHEVTLVSGDDAPLTAALGQYAETVAGFHTERGVEVVSGAKVTEIVEAGLGLVVRLDDGRELSAATVVLGIGATPAVSWLTDSGVEIDNGVVCDSRGATSLPGVVAVGDCAAWFDSVLRRHHRVEHWTGAREQASIAAATLLADGTAPKRSLRAPYVWSNLHGRQIQMAGHREIAHDATVEEGSIESGSFLVVYRRYGVPVAALAVDQPKKFMAVRRGLVTDPAVLAVEGAVA